MYYTQQGIQERNNLNLQVANIILQQQDLHMSHYPVKNQINMSGRGVKFKHIFECVYYSDILRKFSHQFSGKDMQRLIKYDQIYLNQQFTSIQQSEIDLQIKIFHRNLIKKQFNYLENHKQQICNIREQQNSPRRNRKENDA